MSYLDDTIRLLDRLHREGEDADAGAELGNLLAQLAARARRGELRVESSSRFAISAQAAWMNLDLATAEGHFVRLELGKGKA